MFSINSLPFSVVHNWNPLSVKDELYNLLPFSTAGFPPANNNVLKAIIFKQCSFLKEDVLYHNISLLFAH